MVLRAQSFGGAHTELKLRVVMDYLEQYLKVMKAQPFRLSYIDAFAGTGWRRAGAADDGRQGRLLPAAEASKGSALRVFDLAYRGRRFDRFVFGDRKPAALRALQAAVAERFPDPGMRPPAEFHAVDADALIAAECDRLRTSDRAVMFLDPFGMQVSWSSIERIARTGRIDLWYLAPTGIAMTRLMQRRAEITDVRRRRLDEALGGAGWEAAIYSRFQDLLGHERKERERGHDAVIAYFESRWRKLFGDGALSPGLRLKHRSNVPYLLCFACSNPNPKARGPALRIAEHLTERASDGQLF